MRDISLKLLQQRTLKGDPKSVNSSHTYQDKNPNLTYEEEQKNSKPINDIPNGQ